MKYLIIGNGKVANNFANYLSLLKIPFEKWDRNTDVSLEKSVQDCNTALILIKDSEIDGFIEDNPPLKDKKLVHFSASLDSNFAQSIHPLASFTENLKTLEEYKNIPFITHEGEPSFSEIFPTLENPSHQIPKEKAALYHALCVASGNFTVLLWQEVFKKFEIDLNMPIEFPLAYFDNISKNIKEDHKKALSGPIDRKDMQTIEHNLKALQDDKLETIYKAFVKEYLDEKK